MSYGNQPPGGYGAPPGGYGAPPSGYGAPPPQFAYAGMGKRLAAVILDSIIVCLATIPGWILFAIATAGAVSAMAIDVATNVSRSMKSGVRPGNVT